MISDPEREPKLLLIKHAMPEIVESVSSHQWRLSEQGQADSKRLADELAVYRPEVVVMSAELKAVETGQIVARRLDCVS